MSICLLSVFVLFPWCTTYSDPIRLIYIPRQEERRVILILRQAERRWIDIFKEKVEVKKILDLGIKSSFIFNKTLFYIDELILKTKTWNPNKWSVCEECLTNHTQRLDNNIGPSRGRIDGEIILKIVLELYSVKKQIKSCNKLIYFMIVEI